MNAVLIAVLIMLILSGLRVHVLISLLVGSITAGILANMSLSHTMEAFNEGIKNGASIALSYALLGVFAISISKSGLPHALSNIIINSLTHGGSKTKIKWLLITVIGLVSISSQNILPIHIAFIPILIPPLLFVMAKLNLDRRMMACIISFGLVTPYMFLPIGFGNIFLNEILMANISKAGMDVSNVNVMEAMSIPALGMLFGLLFSIFISYRKPRKYSEGKIKNTEKLEIKLNKRSIYICLIAIVVAFAVQLYSNSMILGALAGFLLFVGTGIIKRKEVDDTFVEGVKMMAMIGFVMITAQGFAEVLNETGEIPSLVNASISLFSENKIVASFFMLLVGLIITMGIGSSFSTIPVIAAIYVPLCIKMGFSPMATVCLIGAAGAIGDTGSPASDSSLSVTAGLNIDGQHDHIKDTVIPTFIHYNIPLFLAGWIASLML
ncbi:TRAP transporter large permease subunit [Apibacter muscae]|uniref:TRAP transporter large permease subunit n=1 Tax=Apibacter muscae TaxID=2509004 RepID=A0A563DAQ9_9FLAO|nr:Na+/H+ antiporter NhaC family protein [Apibacter muscae]TWP23227.1 TRAP transporter large permease subunit [Apibacter muscae]TWP27305.1 TRAP transporter large permease subunit [Apibacter muscae]TWP28526.1 TRAP transporter large permease subunit [Apibacter muscae]